MRHPGLIIMVRSVLFFVLLASLYAPMRADPEYKLMGQDIFDRQVNGEELVDKAITRAQQEHKRIVLFFGANWCPWCRELHHAFTEDPSILAVLRPSFILVYIDANTRNNTKRNPMMIERYGNPVKNGLPALVLLDQDGTQLTTQETGPLAGSTDEEVAKRVTEFLAKWAPQTTSKKSN